MPTAMIPMFTQDSRAIKKKKKNDTPNKRDLD